MPDQLSVLLPARTSRTDRLYIFSPPRTTARRATSKAIDSVASPAAGLTPDDSRFPTFRYLARQAGAYAKILNDESFHCGNKTQPSLFPSSLGPKPPVGAVQVSHHNLENSAPKVRAGAVQTSRCMIEYVLPGSLGWVDMKKKSSLYSQVLMCPIRRSVQLTTKGGKYRI